VKWIEHDAASKRQLPFPDKYFDVFTSCASLQLIGLGRYGDQVNGNALPEFLSELDRVMGPESDLIVSVPVGINYLNFNEGWRFDLKTWAKLFGPNWQLTSYIFDLNSSPGNVEEEFRFTKTLPVLEIGDYKIAHLIFSRASF
jgi:SAM-dependent methyltransferase